MIFGGTEGPARRSITFAIFAILALAVAAPGADTEPMKASTVKITVIHGEGTAAGSGIILCQRSGRVDILTAKHVLTGQGLVDDSGEGGRRFRGVESYEISFYRNLLLPVRIPAADAVIQKAEYKDLALLTLVGVDAPLTTVRLGDSAALKSGSDVESVGHLDIDWDWTRGPVRSVGEFIRHGSLIDHGYSGGPLYNAAGELVGVNLQAIGGAARAMPIEEAKRTVDRWIDPQCLSGSVAPSPALPPPVEKGASIRGQDQPKPGERKVESIAGVDFAWRYIPAGSFHMGSLGDERGHQDDEHRHYVTLTRGFWMSETEVTQRQWQAILETKASTFSSCGADCPVETISWYEALRFANRLSQISDREPCFELIGLENVESGLLNEYKEVLFKGSACEGYRLPTEAEWEYAARSGTSTEIYTGAITTRGKNYSPELDKIAWYAGNSGVEYEGGLDCSYSIQKQYPADNCGTHRVGLKEENTWGLLDMIGNVSEWVWDLYGMYSANAEDPEGPHDGSSRVLRGGSWANDGTRYYRAANRGWKDPHYRHAGVGFRLVRTAL